MKNQRVIYLDTLKGFSILFVVFCHFVLLPSDSVSGNILMALAWCAVPCFMMVSGGLMHARKSFSWKNYIYRIFKMYAVLCIWRLIYFLVYLIFFDLSPSKSSVVQYLFLFSDIEGLNVGFMWYMIAYLVCMLIYPITWFLFHSAGNLGKQTVIFIMLLSFLSGIAVSSCNIFIDCITSLLKLNDFSISGLRKILPFGNYANMIFYFTFGAFLYEYKETIKERLAKKRCFPCCLAAAGLLLLLLVKYRSAHTFSWNGIYISNGYNLFGTSLLSVGIYSIFLLLDSGRICTFISKYIGQYTMGIYYTHYLILILCGKYLYPHLGEYSLALNILKTIIVTCICILITVIFRKIPFLKTLVK